MTNHMWNESHVVMSPQRVTWLVANCFGFRAHIFTDTALKCWPVTPPPRYFICSLKPERCWFGILSHTRMRDAPICYNSVTNHSTKSLTYTLTDCWCKSDCVPSVHKAGRVDLVSIYPPPTSSILLVFINNVEDKQSLPSLFAGSICQQRIKRTVYIYIYTVYSYFTFSKWNPWLPLMYIPKLQLMCKHSHLNVKYNEILTASFEMLAPTVQS